MAEKVEVSQEDIAFVRSLEDCPDKPLHESMFVPFFASKIGEYRAAAFEAGRQQGLREAAEVAGKCPVRYATVRDGGDEWHIECRFKDGQKFAAVTVDKEHEDLADWIASAITALMKGEGE